MLTWLVSVKIHLKLHLPVVCWPVSMDFRGCSDVRGCRVHPSAFLVLGGLDLQESLGFQGHEKNIYEISPASWQKCNAPSEHKGRGWMAQNFTLGQWPFMGLVVVPNSSQAHFSEGSSLAEKYGHHLLLARVACHISIVFFLLEKQDRCKNRTLGLRISRWVVEDRDPRFLSITSGLFLWAAQKVSFCLLLQ